MVYGDRERPVVVTTSVTPTGAAVAVHNEGRAIPLALQERIFEPMERGGAEVASGARSVGLGLYIVRAIAQAHGGRVELRSVPGEGTTFTVHLAATDPAPG